MTKAAHSQASAYLREILVAERVEAGLTQNDVARRLRRPQSFVSKYETGERRLDVVEFLEVARALSIDPAGVIRRIAERGVLDK